ncbi:hypothetical protein QW060_00545 [Myroides ceti]|uniref:Uncharacterized protein n=1 Tax=Paenimyroides ceti TaxID=395087 RepID=A0ABT8CPD7_9FLAO|nr:hypothetical protein [Paenimyroides ceti]MDN3705621.1 hypothetical protein [Paenimyroides ceti]
MEVYAFVNSKYDEIKKLSYSYIDRNETITFFDVFILSTILNSQGF